MVKKKTAPKKVQKRSFILILGLVLLIGYFTITIADNLLEYKDRRAVYEQLVADRDRQVEENEHLQAIVDDEDKSEYMEQVAREKLGFVMPGEKVFYDVTPGA